MEIRGSIMSVLDVCYSSLASRSGVRVGDVLCKFGSLGRKVGTMANLRGNAIEADSPISIEVLRVAKHYFPITIIRAQPSLNYSVSSPKTSLNTTPPIQQPVPNPSSKPSLKTPIKTSPPKALLNHTSPTQQQIKQSVPIEDTSKPSLSTPVQSNVSKVATIQTTNQPIMHAKDIIPRRKSELKKKKPKSVVFRNKNQHGSGIG